MAKICQDCEDIRNLKGPGKSQSFDTERIECAEQNIVENKSRVNNKSAISIKPNLPSQNLKVVEVEKEEPDESAREKIIVIDGIANPDLYKNSKAILKEFNSYCPKINTSASFSLARGGVTIYLQSSSDRDKALQKLPDESFGGGFKKSPNPQKTPICVSKRSRYMYPDKRPFEQSERNIK